MRKYPFNILFTLDFADMPLLPTFGRVPLPALPDGTKIRFYGGFRWMCLKVDLIIK